MKSLIRHVGISVILFSLPFATLAKQGGSGGIENPLKNNSNIFQFIQSIIDAAIQLGAVIAVIAVIYAGFLFVTAQGEEKKITDAKRTLIYTLIGVAILLGARVLTDVVINTVKSVAP